MDNLSLGRRSLCRGAMIKDAVIIALRESDFLRLLLVLSAHSLRLLRSPVVVDSDAHLILCIIL